MFSEIQTLLWTAITIACLHTVSGPDHYLPFVALAKARGWSVTRMVMWTLLCGCGHVWSSVLLALGGAAIGWSLSSMQWLEGVRGSIAGWVLLLFGLVYTVWGFVKVEKKHKHFDVYDDGSVYVYEHNHSAAVAPKERYAVTPWVMFLIFVLGPCEPMIPLLYVPAAKASWWSLALLIGVYTIFTLACMLVMVLLGYHGLNYARFQKMEPYVPVLSGLAIFICGAGMVFFSW